MTCLLQRRPMSTCMLSFLLLGTPGSKPISYTIGPYKISYDERSLLVADTRLTSKIALIEARQPFVHAAQSADQITGSSGSWVIHRHDKDVCHGLAAEITQHLTDGPVNVSGPFAKPCVGLRWSLIFSREDDDRALNFNLSFHNASSGTSRHDRLLFSYTRAADERFYGFGQQYTHFDAAGSLVPILAREGGIGRGLEPISAFLNAGGREAGGDERTTYSATPHYITSSLRSLHLTNTEPCWFDLRRRGAVEVSIMAVRMLGRLLGAPSALALVEQCTHFTGRMTPLPEWAHAGGVVVGIQGGTARVATLTDRLMEAGVPLAGVWLQDWAGALEQDVLGMREMRLRWNWRLDEVLYDGWPSLVANLSSRGVRILTYGASARPSPLHDPSACTTSLHH